MDVVNVVAHPTIYGAFNINVQLKEILARKKTVL
jgi:hypothetical protein